MTTWTSLFPDEAQLLGRKFFKFPGTYSYQVPSLLLGKSPAFMRCACKGVGGDGDHWGGCGAYSRAVVPVTPGETLQLQVGHTATGSVPGDSWVKRNDGTVIIYADRGRGNGNGGQAALSIGQVLYDGLAGDNNNGIGGGANHDANDYAPLFGAVRGADYLFNHTSDFGGGGHGHNTYDQYGNLQAVSDWNAGCGIVGFEFYDSHPHY